MIGSKNQTSPNDPFIRKLMPSQGHNDPSRRVSQEQYRQFAIQDILPDLGMGQTPHITGFVRLG